MSLTDFSGSFDPFLDVEGVQSQRIKAFCRIIVAGTDITDHLAPHLISVRVMDGIDPGMNNATLEIDDRDARLPIPPIGSEVIIWLGWQNETMIRVFRGLTQDLEYGFGRKQGGRRMWVYASVVNLLDSAKQPMQNHLGDGAPPGQDVGEMHTLPDAIQKFAAGAGYTAKVNPTFKDAKYSRDYWSQNNESVMNWSQSLVNDLGGMGWVRIDSVAKTIEINKFGEFVDGTPGDLIKAEWGKNLISLRVRPMAARPMWDGARQTWYNRLKGQWQLLASKFNFPAPWDKVSEAMYQSPNPAPNANVAGAQAGGFGLAGKAGPGRILINGEPGARGGTGKVQVIGVRPGVDGIYSIDTAEHLYSRQGYLTWLDVTVQLNVAVNNVGSGFILATPPGAPAGAAGGTHPALE